MASKGNNSGTGNPTPTSQLAPSGKKTVAQNNQKRSEKHEDTELSVEGKKMQMFNSLPAKLQDNIKSMKGESGHDVGQLAATFIVKSVRENKLDEVDGDALQTIMEFADPAILQKSGKDLKDKVFKNRDGKQISMSEFLDIRLHGPERQNSDLKKLLKDRGIELKEKEDQVKKMEKKLKEKEDKLVKMEDTMKEKDDKLVKMEDTMKEKDDKLVKMEDTMKEKDDKLKKNDHELSQKTEDFDVLKKKHDGLEQEIKGVCKGYDDEADKMKQEITKLKQNVGQQKAALEENQTTFGKMEKQIEEANNRITSIENDKMALHMQYKETRYALEKANKTVDYMKESHEDAMRHKDNQLKELKVDRDDLRYRFSKLAGEKLTDQNPDIADLSDPNRAMKLSERFGGLYDDQWTDAYEHLKGKKKMTVKDAITLLLDVLKKCETFCNKLKETQMDSLNNVLLHPSQDVSSFGSEPRKHVGGLKEHARIKSDDKKAVRELRRQIGVRDCVLEEVKQVFIQESKSWPDKKVLEGCIPYLQKCAEICWLMVLHDPPLYMKMDVKRGDHFDTSLYSVYSASGDKIDFLVWPALFNEKNGGLLSKGTAEPFKVVTKT